MIWDSLPTLCDYHPEFCQEEEMKTTIGGKELQECSAEELDRIAAEIEKLKESRKVKEVPEIGDKYYVVNSEPATFTYNKDNVDKHFISTGLWSFTEEGVEKIRDRLILQETMRKMAKGFVPDWEDTTQKKYNIIYEHKIKMFKIDYSFGWQRPFYQYYKTREDAQAVVDRFGSEMLRLM